MRAKDGGAESKQRGGISVDTTNHCGVREKKKNKIALARQKAEKGSETQRRQEPKKDHQTRRGAHKEVRWRDRELKKVGKLVLG